MLHSRTAVLLGSLLQLAAAFDCAPSAFEKIVAGNATVTFAHPLQNDSSFHVPASDIAYPISPTHLQALCVVEINVTSSPSSAYSFGLFLPDHWNNRFLTVGNGGFAGGINWLDMAAGVGYGFATMSTDTGHNSTSSDLTWGVNQPEKRIDFGYRAMHGSVVMAKQVVEAHYGRAPQYSYYSGCSTGGRQGIRDIQLYPEDFGGMLAGAPAWWTTHLQTWTVKLALYNLPNTSAHHIPPVLFPAIGAEILKQCDPQDRLIDNIISDPMRCNIATLYHIYNDYVETNQTLVFPHLELGSEDQWDTLLGSYEPSPLGTQYIQNFVLDDSAWNFNFFNYSIVELTDHLDPGNATADDFDMSPVYARGGRLLHYHGFADALIPTGSSIYFYKQVLQTLLPKGIELNSWYRFFLVPGMQHCSGTPADVNAPWYFAGATQAGEIGHDTHSVPGFSDGQHDALLALMEWVEEGRAPESIVATKWVDDMEHDMVLRQRPLCPYPKQARYLEVGNPDVAGSWRREDLYDVRS